MKKILLSLVTIFGVANASVDVLQQQNTQIPQFSFFNQAEYKKNFDALDAFAKDHKEFAPFQNMFNYFAMPREGQLIFSYYQKNVRRVEKKVKGIESLVESISKLGTKGNPGLNQKAINDILKAHPELLKNKEIHDLLAKGKFDKKSLQTLIQKILAEFGYVAKMSGSQLMMNKFKELSDKLTSILKSFKGVDQNKMNRLKGLLSVALNGDKNGKGKVFPNIDFKKEKDTGINNIIESLFSDAQSNVAKSDKAKAEIAEIEKENKDITDILAKDGDSKTLLAKQTDLENKLKTAQGNFTALDTQANRDNAQDAINNPIPVTNAHWTAVGNVANADAAQVAIQKAKVEKIIPEIFKIAQEKKNAEILNDHVKSAVLGQQINAMKAEIVTNLRHTAQNGAKLVDAKAAAVAVRDALNARLDLIDGNFGMYVYLKDQIQKMTNEIDALKKKIVDVQTNEKKISDNTTNLKKIQDELKKEEGAMNDRLNALKNLQMFFKDDNNLFTQQQNNNPFAKVA